MSELASCVARKVGSSFCTKRFFIPASILPYKAQICPRLNIAVTRGVELRLLLSLLDRIPQTPTGSWFTVLFLLVLFWAFYSELAAVVSPSVTFSRPSHTQAPSQPYQAFVTTSYFFLSVFPSPGCQNCETPSHFLHSHSLTISNSSKAAPNHWLFREFYHASPLPQ